MAPLQAVTFDLVDGSDGEHSLHDHFHRSLRIEPSSPISASLQQQQPQGPSRDSATTATKKRVRFNFEKRCLDPVNKYYDDEDIVAKWFTASDLLLIKENAKNQSATIRRSGPSEECRLTMAYKKTSLMLAGDFKELVKLPTTSPDQDLRQWCSWNDGRRGLERFSSREYCYTRRGDILNAREAVLAEQDRQTEAGVKNDDLIAKASREVSRRARTFALFMGEADSKQQTRPLENAQRTAPSRKRSKIDLGELRQGAATVKLVTVAAAC
jgi:hypothetical protein